MPQTSPPRVVSSVRPLALGCLIAIWSALLIVPGCEEAPPSIVGSDGGGQAAVGQPADRVRPGGLAESVPTSAIKDPMDPDDPSTPGVETTWIITFQGGTGGQVHGVTYRIKVGNAGKSMIGDYMEDYPLTVQQGAGNTAELKIKTRDKNEAYSVEFFVRNAKGNGSAEKLINVNP